MLGKVKRFPRRGAGYGKQGIKLAKEVKIKTQTHRSHREYTTPKCPTILDDLNEFNCLQKEVNVLTWIST